MLSILLPPREALLLPAHSAKLQEPLSPVPRGLLGSAGVRGHAGEQRDGGKVRHCHKVQANLEMKEDTKTTVQ